MDPFDPGNLYELNSVNDPPWRQVGHLSDEITFTKAADDGIRPHLYFPTREEMTIHFETTKINRPSAELVFDMCFRCQSEHLTECSCHERGYN
jgi:hypothetical protein